MNLQIHGKNIEITESIREYIEDKIGKVEKLLGDLPHISILVKVSTIKQKHSVEVTIPLGDITIRAEEATDDMYKSIDIVEEKLKRKIRKIKTKDNRFSREKLEFVSNDNPVEEFEEVVRIKKYNIKPMSTDEAILQMNMLDHNFFVYMDEVTNEMNVIYKRKTGNYGLIQSSLVSI